jgi:hypothetical protein
MPPKDQAPQRIGLVTNEHESGLARGNESTALAGANGDDRSGQMGQGSNGQPRTVGRAATHSQVRAIRAIASKHRVDLARLLHERFCVGRPEELSVPEASALIDELKETAQQCEEAP